LTRGTRRIAYLPTLKEREPWRLHISAGREDASPVAEPKFTEQPSADD
jgi:hypothetical protein